MGSMGHNHIRTFMLIAGLTALFMGIGFMLGGQVGMIVALLFAGVGNFISYWNADKIVLSMYKAQEVDEHHRDPVIRRYAEDTREMAIEAGMPVPRITIIENPQPNAFATGRNPENAAVAATTGLLQMLDRREVRGVMAHELAHVKNRDTLTMTLTATIAGAISALANFAMFFGGNRERSGGLIGTLAIMFLAPMAASLVQMAISRGREYEADKGGAEISGDPEALASALQKIEQIAHGGRGAVNEQAERNPATAHMFIINPLNGKGGDKLFSTHPATHNRITALMKLKGQFGGASKPRSETSTHPKRKVDLPAFAKPIEKKDDPWG